MNIIDKIKESFSAKLLLGIFVLWIVLAIIFGFSDLYISIAVVDQASLIGIFGRDFGEAPGWGLIGIGLSILIGSAIKEVKKQKIGGFIVIIITLVLVLYYLLDEAYQDVINYSSMTICVIIFSIVTFSKDWRNYSIVAFIIVVLAIINVLLFVQITKIVWGRVRFRDLLAGYSNFTPWFLPQGITGHKSFPSGHTAMGFMLLPLLILVKDRDTKDPKRIIVTVAIIGWGIFVALSRILIGAHYASDVLFSSAMASIITILLYELVKSKL
jgi:membrane-associated phospholipid phosphatase